MKILEITANAIYAQENGKLPVWLPKNFCKMDATNENVIALPTWLKKSKNITEVESNECLGLVAVYNEAEKKVNVTRLSKVPKESVREAFIRKTYKKALFNYKGFRYAINTVDGVEQTADNTLYCVGPYMAGESIKMKNDFEKFLVKQGLKKEAKPEKKEPKVVEKIKKEIKENSPVNHKEFETIKTCVMENIPVYLYGPAGSGKNFTLEQVAKELGFDFYFTNSIQQEYKLTGFIDAGGTYHETEFYKAFKNGGLFFLDEMDASIPEVLVLLNAAIANGYFEFPNGKITAHKNFRVVAAGNTIGSGADELYTGRLVLDQATLDRFVSIEFDYDRNIEEKLAGGNTELVDFVEGLRKTAAETGIRATFSYRCIMSVKKLEGKLELSKVLKIAVLKGMDNDTINTLKQFGTGNKYYEAMMNLGA